MTADNQDILDSVLNLEEKFYDEGFVEGAHDGQEAGLVEGRQFGIQTGFQRYITLGILQGRLDGWKENAASDKKLEKHVTSLESYLTDIPMSNSDDSVDKVTKTMKQAKGKAKVIMSVAKDPNPLDLMDDQLQLKATEETIEDVA